MKRLGEINIVAMGKTGSGKSTLVNTIFSEELAHTDGVQRVTKNIEKYSKTLLLPIGSEMRNNEYGRVLRKVNLFDTVGIELDKENNNITEEILINIKELIKTSQEKEIENDITMIWYCVRSGSKRFEDYEINAIKKISLEYEIPFVIVMTQCFIDEESEFEREIKRNMPKVTIIRVMAKDYVTRVDVAQAFGMDNLMRKSILEFNDKKTNILGDKLIELSKERKERIENIRYKGEGVIEEYAKKATKVGIIPLAGAPFVHGICIKMISDLNKIVGLDNSKELAEDIFVNVIVGALVTPFMAVPVFSAVIARAYIEQSGETYLEALMGVIEKSSDYELKNNKLMVERIREELKKRNS